jgi:hypothetical protein
MNDTAFKIVVISRVFVTGYIFGAAPRPPVKVACKAYQWAEIYHMIPLRGTKEDK